MSCVKPRLAALATLILTPWSAAASDPPSDTGGRAARLLAYVEIWNTGELDRLDGLVAPDFARYAGPGESCRSLADLKQIIASTRVLYNHLQITVDDHMTGGDKGAFRGEFYGVHKDVNRVVRFPVMSMVRFADGMIAEEWIIGDNFLPLVGLGYELVPPGFETIPPATSSTMPGGPPGHGSR